MTQNIKTIVISLVISAGVMLFALNAPANWFNVRQFLPQKQVFGSLSLTTLNGTDNLTNFPTTYNANNTILNNGKEDISDLQSTSTLAIPTLSSLSSIGTITTGVWNASTIAVAHGGTGSTTLSSNQVLIGAGTSGVNDVVGWGSSGQTLTSNGGTSAPTWQSGTFDQTQNYLLTGNWNFIANTLIKNLFASSTSANPLVLDGVSLNTPSSQGASSTVLVNDGSGNLKWQMGYASTTATTTTFSTSGFNANQETGSQIVYCAEGHVTGGGYSGTTAGGGSGQFQGYLTAQDSPTDNNTAWEVGLICVNGGGSGACPTDTITVYATCILP